MTKRRHRRNGTAEEIAAEAVIVNPGEIERYAETHKGKTEITSRGDGPLWRMEFGGVGTTTLYVWADSLDDAFEESVEWLDDNAPGLLTDVTMDDLKQAAEDIGVDWDPAWPNESRKFQKVVEAAETDLTLIGHTTLKHGQYVASGEWGGGEVSPGSVEWREVVARSWAEGVPDIEVDYEAFGPDEKEPTNGLRIETSGDTVEITEWTDIYDATGDEESKDASVSRQDAAVSLDKLFDPKAPHRGSYGGDNDKPSLEDVLRMGPERREKAVIGAAIAYMGYAGGDESIVDYVGG